MTNLQNPDYTSLSKNAFFAPKTAIFATLKGLCSHKIQPKVLKLHKSYFYVCRHQKMPGSNQNKKFTQKRDTLVDMTHLTYQIVSNCLLWFSNTSLQ